MKRGSVWLVVVLCMVTMFSSRVVNAERKLVFWHMVYNDQDFLQSVNTSFSQLTGYEIETQYMEINDLQLAIVKSVLDDQAPDIIMIPSDKVGIKDFELSKVPVAWQSPQISAANLQTVKVGNDYYGAPILGGNHIMLYYNKKFVKSPAKTWAELEIQMPEIEKQGVKAIGWNYSEMYWLVGFVGAYGGWPLKDGVININTEEFKSGLKFYKSLTTRGLVDSSCAYDCSSERFLNGEFAYTLNGDWIYNEVKKRLGDDFGVATIPNIGDKEVTPMFSTIALAFPNHSVEKKGDILKTYMQFMQSQLVQKQWFQKASRYPVDGSVIKDIKVGGDENLKAYLLQLKRARAMPADTVMTYAWLGMGKWFKQFIDNKISADDAIKLMQLYAQKKLKEKNDEAK